MFTGLIRHQGKLRSRSQGGIEIECPELRPSLALGDSVAVNGTCLTVRGLNQDAFEADILPETSANTTLGELPLGAPLNLEPALAAGEKFGGHFVQGHIDGVAELAEKRESRPGFWQMKFTLPGWLEPLLIPKGSIAIDGVSLTVQEIGKGHFSVAVIPATLKDTNLGNIMPGARVNIEADMLVKIVRQSVSSLVSTKQGVTLEQLREMGYGG